jgi:pimeloyl-ACP methyl ester carboxylesterase
MAITASNSLLPNFLRIPFTSYILLSDWRFQTLPNRSLQCLYLHGFASGPNSTKARFFRDHFQKVGLPVHVPDLNGNNFSDLTLTGQLSVIDNAIENFADNHDVLLMGSSMGGLLSALTANRRRNVRGMILLAPGFGLNKRWHELLGPAKLKEWKERGSIDVFHYGTNREMPLKYGFIEDAENYSTENIRVDVPCLVIHGVNDDVVPAEESRNFQKLNPTVVELHLLDSDHTLGNVMAEMADLTDSFLKAHALA